jgi:hypothetical protein
MRFYVTKDEIDAIMHDRPVDGMSPETMAMEEITFLVCAAYLRCPTNHGDFQRLQRLSTSGEGLQISCQMASLHIYPRRLHETSI